MQVLGSPTLLRFGECELDVGRKVLRRGGEIVPLPLKAVELLCVLVENRGQVVSKEELIGKVWPDSFVEDSVLTQNVYLLRKTLRSNSTRSSITNVPRRGYVFAELVDFDNETVIERHLFERVEIEEINGKHSDSDTKIDLPPLVRGSRRRILGFSTLAVAILLAFGAFFFFRSGFREAAVTSPPAFKLKAVSSPSKIKSLSVLPFKSSSENFGADFANDLSIRLGSKNKFAVRPIALLNEYAKHGAEFENDFVLEGDVRTDDNRFLADVRLIDTSSGTEIWSDKFEYDNVVQLQDAIANKTAAILMDRLTPGERDTVSKRLPSNLTAYENFQTGYLLWRRRADGSAYLQKAIELDQSFSPAYALLASAKATQGVKGSPAAKEAEQLLQKAFALDENSADAYAVQGFIRMFHYFDWDAAEKSLKNAIELDGNNINARHWLGVYYSIRRRLDDAKAEMQLALELDPTNPTLLADIGQLHYFALENDSAVEYINRAIAIDPKHPFANGYLGLIPFQPPDVKTALQSLETSAAKNDFTLPYINVDPRYDGLRGSKRFAEVLRRVNLAQ